MKSNFDLGDYSDLKVGPLDFTKRMKIYERLNLKAAKVNYPGENRSPPRLNHNGTNLLRQVKHMEHFIKSLEGRDNEYADILNQDGFKENLLLAIYFRSLGRVDEMGFGSSHITLTEYNMVGGKEIDQSPTYAYVSAKLYIHVVSQLGINIDKDSDADFMAEALTQSCGGAWGKALLKEIKGTENTVEKQQFQKRYLLWVMVTLAHDADHIRYFGPYQYDNEISSYGNKFFERCCGMESEEVLDASIQLKARAKKYCQATGSKAIELLPDHGLALESAINMGVAYQKLQAVE